MCRGDHDYSLYYTSAATHELGPCSTPYNLYFVLIHKSSSSGLISLFLTAYANSFYILTKFNVLKASKNIDIIINSFCH